MSQQAVDRFALPKTEIAKGLDISTDTKLVQHYATATDFTPANSVMHVKIATAAALDKRR
jgi:hypothetical protein